MNPTLAIDRSSARTLVAFGDETIELEGRDPAWPVRVRDLLAGRRPGAIAVGLGPGSFAGIRSAIAFAQGLGLGLGLRPMGFRSAELCALAAGAPEVTVVGDARRGTLWLIRYAMTAGRLASSGDFRLVARGHFAPDATCVSPDAARLTEFAMRPVTLTARSLARALPCLTLTEDPTPIYLHPAVGAAPAE